MLFEETRGRVGLFVSEDIGFFEPIWGGVVMLSGVVVISDFNKEDLRGRFVAEDKVNGFDLLLIGGAATGL